MIIKKITLSNFRQYRNTEIEFSTDPEHNVTVIQGNNGFGKTTLIRAFLWCLYRRNDFKKNPDLLNNDVAKEMAINEIQVVSVSLEVTHCGVPYLIRTRESYRRAESGKVSIQSKAHTDITKIENGNAISISPDLVEKTISKILRIEISDYFFYDGERNSIEAVSGRSNIKSAITNMVGLDRVSRLADFFAPNSGKVYKAFQNQLSTVDEVKLSSIQYEIENKLTEKSNKIKIKDDKSDELEKLQILVEENEKKIEANREVTELQEEKVRLSKRIESSKYSLPTLFQAEVDAFSKGNQLLNSILLATYQKHGIEDILSHCSFQAEKSFTHISEEAIDDLIARGKCLCGTCIEKDSIVYRTLIAAKDRMQPRDYSSYVKNFIDSMEALATGQSYFYTNLKQRLEDFIEKEDELENIESNYELIKEKLAGRVGVGELQKENNKLNQQIGALKQHIRQLETEISSCDNSIKNLEIEQTRLTENDNRNIKIYRCIDYIKAIYSSIVNERKEKETQVFNAIQKNVDEIFKFIYHGERQLKINPQTYAITTTTYGDLLENSGGQDMVKNYSFIAGLISVVRENVLKDSLVGSSSDKDFLYPLVIDAPFSTVDKEHTVKICKVLPERCNQLIIFMFDKDYEVAIDSLRPVVGKEWLMEKKSETLISMREV